MRTLEAMMHRLGQGYTRTDHDNVDVLRRSLQQQVAHPASDDITLHAERVRLGAYHVQRLILQFRV